MKSTQMDCTSRSEGSKSKHFRYKDFGACTLLYFFRCKLQSLLHLFALPATNELRGEKLDEVWSLASSDVLDSNRRPFR